MMKGNILLLSLRILFDTFLKLQMNYAIIKSFEDNIFAHFFVMDYLLGKASHERE